MSDTGAPVSSAPVQDSAPVSNEQGNVPAKTSQESAGNAAKEVLAKYKIKVDGRDEEVDVETLKREYSKAKGAEKKFEEAAKMRKQAEEFVDLLRKDPVKLINDPRIGGDFRKLAEKYLTEQLEQEMLDPKEKQIREYERKLKEYENQQKELRQQQEAAQQKALEDRYTQEYGDKIAEALTSSGLPKTPRTVARMAALMERNIEFGLDVEPKDIVHLVRQSYIDDHKEMYGQTDGDTLIQIVGDDFVNKIRQADLKRLRGNSTPANAPKREPATSTGSTARSEANKKLSIHEWREQLQKKFG